MRVLAVVIASCAMSQTAFAQTAECRSIADPARRLACYDRADRSATSQGSSAAARPAAAAGVDTPKAQDSFSAEEDERVNAQLRNICRGC
jgi:hypothetical protein